MEDLWAEEQVGADLLGVQVLINQQVDDDGKLFGNKILAGLLQTRQNVTEGVQDGFNLKHAKGN